MTSRALLLSLAALPALAGCGTVNRGLESVHQPVVSRTDLAFDLDAAGGALSTAETDRLDGWLRTVRVGYGDRIAVDAGDGGSRRAVAQVATAAARYGLLLSDTAPVTGAAVAPGTVRVIVSRMRAAVPNCPDWSRNLTNEFEGNTHSNYGCATNANLAAMIADPADLVRGQAGSTVSDPAVSYKAIDTYRTAKPTGGGALGSTVSGGTK